MVIKYIFRVRGIQLNRAVPACCLAGGDNYKNNGLIL